MGYLTGRPCDDGGSGAPAAPAERGLVAVESVGVVVVEPVVSEALVDGQPHVVEAVDLHDDLALVVVEGVVGGVAHHLVQLQHRLVGHVASRNVVLVHRYLHAEKKIGVFIINPAWPKIMALVLLVFLWQAFLRLNSNQKNSKYLSV